MAFCGSDKLMRRLGGDDDLAARVVPAVTVVLEGRSICHRISLHKHESYRSLATALRKMFVQDNAEEEVGDSDEGDNSVDLSNAIPGHLVAYEDMENDLLLAGDLNWKSCACDEENKDIASQEGKLKEGIQKHYDVRYAKQSKKLELK